MNIDYVLKSHGIGVGIKRGIPIPIEKTNLSEQPILLPRKLIYPINNVLVLSNSNTLIISNVNGFNSLTLVDSKYNLIKTISFNIESDGYPSNPIEVNDKIIVKFSYGTYANSIRVFDMLLNELKKISSSSADVLINYKNNCFIKYTSNSSTTLVVYDENLNIVKSTSFELSTFRCCIYDKYRDVIYVSQGEKKFNVLNADDFTLKTSSPLYSEMTAAITSIYINKFEDDGVIYISCSYGGDLLKIDADNLTKIWYAGSFYSAGSTNGILTIRENYLLYSYNNSLMKINSISGVIETSPSNLGYGSFVLSFIGRNNSITLVPKTPNSFIYELVEEITIN